MANSSLIANRRHRHLDRDDARRHRHLSPAAVAQFPTCATEISVRTTYTGADALTVEQSVHAHRATMSGVENMNYMTVRQRQRRHDEVTVNFEVGTDVNTIRSSHRCA